ncbi:hypothetical protein [Salinilacihabitans rarus]|uniref:hypothetical protein n=1 Tax=Salinilacihabitans rarus TaxID=2961596 RepID=UPI0020C92615|nr:hypothetical protein [Salinilacihabitans rarus]
MPDDVDASAAEQTLPDDVRETIDDLNEAELRAVIDYAQARRQEVHSTVTDRLEVGPGEEIVRAEERPGYTEVVVRLTGENESDDDAANRYLYHVREEPHVNGETRLHWEYIGRVRE